MCRLGVTGMTQDLAVRVRVRGSLLLLCNPLKVLKDFCSSLKVLVTSASVPCTGVLVLDALWVVFRDGDFLIVHPY